MFFTWRQYLAQIHQKGVVATFVIDWPVLILIGLIFGYGIKGPLNRSFFFTRAFISGKFVVTLFVIIVYYSYRLAPDWMWMYFVKASDLPGWMVWYMLILYFFAYTSGFAITVEGRKWQGWYPPLLIIAMVVWEVALILALKERYLVVGTQKQFLAGTAAHLAKSTVGTIPVYMTLLLIPLGLGMLLWSRKQKFMRVD